MANKVVGALLLGMMLVGCGGASAEGGEGAVEVPVQYQGAVTSTDTARGEQLFTDVCGACHEGGAAPDLRAESHGAPMIRMTVRQGDGQMPPLGVDRLSDDDLEAVLAYMVSVNAAQ